MRSNMDPLTPATFTLPPALSHIAETASTLATTLHERTPPSPFSPSFPPRSSIMTPTTTNDNSNDDGEENASAQKRRAQVRTVKWVLDAPSRGREMVGEGRRGEAR